MELQDQNVLCPDCGVNYITIKRFNDYKKCISCARRETIANTTNMPYVKWIDLSDDEKERYSVKKGDIFYTRTSETIEEIGLTSICYKDIENATFAGFLIRIRPKTELLNIGYSKYYVSSNIHRRFFVKEMNLVTRASLSQELLKKLPILIPPYSEQQEIAEFLDNKCYQIDKAIQQKEETITKLEEYKKSLIYECVTGKKELV